MKKLMLAIGLGLITGSAYAACQGPYCYDDQGPVITQPLTVNGGYILPNYTGTQLGARTPSRIYEIVISSTVSTNLGGFICISTGTGRGAYVLLASTSTACN